MPKNRTAVSSPRRKIGALSLCAALLVAARAQDTFVAIPPERAAQYRLDFARNFFASPEAEKADRADLYAATKELEGLKGRVAASADNLLRALRIYDGVQVKFLRHYDYLYLRHAVNTEDEASRDEAAALDSEVNARTAFLRQELMLIDDRTLAAFVARRPTLAGYLFAVETARRYRPHTLSLKEEELLSATAPFNQDWQYDLYEKLRARAQAGGAAGGGDRAAREASFKLRYAALASQRDLYAFALTRLAAARTRLAQLRHYADAPSQAYFERYRSRAEVKDLLERLARRADLYKRYQRLRAEYVGRINGYGEVSVWDLPARPADAPAPRFTVGEATRILRDALAPLGAEYGRELAALLDPANGRMDIVPGANRKPGGFSKGFVGTDSVFYSAGFTGSYNDLRVLAHESTHAVQRQLMNRNHVLPANYDGPHYLAESFAIFNEFLLPDYLYEHESDPRRRRFYLEQFLEGKGTIMFVVAPEAMLEEAVYDGVARGDVKGADDLDALTKRIYSRFSIWPDRHDELKSQWAAVQLMYEDPFYDVNYIYGALLPLKFYEMYKRDPRGFAPRYVALMRNGFDAPPAALLKKFLDIDLDDPRLLPDALRAVEDKVNLLEEAYRK